MITMSGLLTTVTPGTVLRRPGKGMPMPELREAHSRSMQRPRKEPEDPTESCNASIGSSTIKTPMQHTEKSGRESIA